MRSFQLFPKLTRIPRRLQFLFLLGAMLLILIPIPLLIIYDAALLELHWSDHSNEATTRVLVMAWIHSLTDLNNHWVLLKEMEEYCRSYDPTIPQSHGYKEEHEGGMKFHIFYRQEGENPNDDQHEVQAVLTQHGCSVEFTHEETLHLSLDRKLGMQDRIPYDAVVHMDLNGVLSLPSLTSFHHAITRARDDSGAVIVCANEEETWSLWLKQMLWLPKIGHSCSSRFSLYSWKAWSSSDCDFDDDNNNNNPQNGNTHPTLRSSSSRNDKDAHVSFQQCLLQAGAWIWVQSDLVVWRRLWWTPWLKLLAWLGLGLLLWGPLASCLGEKLMIRTKRYNTSKQR